MRNYGKCVQKEKSSSIRTSSSAIKKKNYQKRESSNPGRAWNSTIKKEKAKLSKERKRTWSTMMNKIHEKLPKLRSTNLNNSVHLSNSWRSVIVKKRKRKGKIKIKTEERKARRSDSENSSERGGISGERGRKGEREKERERRPWREETGREKEGEGERGERVQRGHSSHDIKRGCRPADSKDSARSAMKRGRTVRRNRKKIGKNEGKEETAETQSFVRYSCSPLHSSSIQLSINLTFGGGAISSRRWLTHSTLPMVFARRWGANRVFLPSKENGTVSSLFSLSIIPISNFFVTYRLLTFVTDIWKW